jgi:hypothetical protein
VSDGQFREPLREPFNVEDAKARDRLIRRFKKIRADAVLDKNTWEYINRTRPDLPPIDTTFEDKIIAWCDGKGPMPTREDIR